MSLSACICVLTISRWSSPRSSLNVHVSNNSFMNKINYFSKQKLILFFSAWLTHDLAFESQRKISPIRPSPPGHPAFSLHFLHIFIFFIIYSLQTIFAIVFWARVNNLVTAPKDMGKCGVRVILSWGNLGLASWKLILTSHSRADSIHQSLSMS